MPLTRMKFDINGDVQYSRAFDAMARETRDMTEPLAQVAESLRVSVSEQFRTEGVAGLGAPWARLNAAYALWKLAAVGPQPILVFTGAMRSEMTSRRAFRISPQRMVYEPDDEKAIYHQEGQGNLPARKMVAVNQATRRDWDRYFAEWLNGLRRGKPIGATV